jgi:small subunit ribosomal protein S8
MMRHDLLSDVLSKIKNAESAGKEVVEVPSSNLVKDVLKILQEEGFIGDFEFIDDKKGGKFKVSLLKKVNECKSIRPRHSVTKEEIIKYEKRYLPAANVGFMIITTSRGVMTHKRARELGIGGKLLAYVY